MELHKNTTNAFIKYLLDHGYPAESIVTEWRVERSLIDIAILDEDRSMPVAIYEVKGLKTSDSLKNGIQQLRRYLIYLGYPVEAGLVFSLEEPPYFEFIDIKTAQNILKKKEEILEHHILPSELISYKILKNSAEPKIRNARKEKKEKTLSTFNWIAWGMAFLTFIFLILENFGILTFTTKRMIVYGIVLVLVVLPFYSELKFGDLSLKRNIKKQKRKQ